MYVLKYINIHSSLILNRQSNTRALKKRIDLLASFDTLTSHLQTTFTALSTAMARSTRCSNTPRKLVTQLENKFDDTGLDKGKGKKLGRAYLAIVLGPSASSAKARILFAVDGLEVKIWGQMDDTADLGCGSAGEPDEGSDGDTQSESSDEQSDSGSEFDSDSDLVDESGSSTDSIIDGSSPLPRSPSPTSSSLSDLEPSTVQRTLMSQAQSQGEDELPDSEVEAVAYASEQQTFLKAERLLSRTLAAACAEDDGRGIACELGTPGLCVIYFILVIDVFTQPQPKHISSSAPRGVSVIQHGRLSRTW